MSYRPETSAGQVRLICTDTDPDNEIFTDAEIEAFLSINSQSVFLSAAMAIDTIANSEILVQKRIKLLDLTTDGPGEADALRKGAESLRAQAAKELVADWIESPVDVFAFREKWIKDFLRGLI